MTQIPTYLISSISRYAAPPAHGIVNIQAQRILSTTSHFTAERFLAAPTPIIDADILCVVDTGIPRYEAHPNTSDELASAAKP